MYRSILLVILITLIAIGATQPAAAAPPTAPNNLDARLAGFPTLTIRLTDERIMAPETSPAGYTLLVEANDTAAAGHAFVFRVPEDVSDEDITAALAGGPASQETPEWFWRAEFLGNGDRAAPGGEAVSLVDLRPGRYIAGDPYRPATEYARFEVTESASAETPNLEADVTGALFEMGFQLPAKVSAGRQVWEVRNTGAMLHEIAIFPVPTGATKAQIEDAISAELAAEQGGDPDAARATIDALGPEWVDWQADLVAGVGVLSPQRVSWAQFDLEPGTYGAVCYVPEPNSMTPHVMFGMTEVFTVDLAQT